LTFRQFKDTDDFVKNYLFAPHQFQLIQKIFEAIRKAGATGTWLNTPDDRHDGRTAISLMDTPEGRAEVEGMLIQIDEGMFT
jgi:uncharacterized protein (DUF2384 family)